VLIGGLVPQLLAASVADAQAHIGTVDIDFGVLTRVDSFADVEAALLRLGWTPQAPGWRWRRGDGGQRLTIEFLCDRDDVANESAVQLPGCQHLFALNLRGAGFAAGSWTQMRIGEGGNGPPTMPVASLEAYLLMKANTITTRGRDKDYYDFVYALLFNEAGVRWRTSGAKSVAGLNVRTNSVRPSTRSRPPRRILSSARLLCGTMHASQSPHSSVN